MKGTVIDTDGHILYRFDNGHDYSADLKTGETIQAFDYVDPSPPVPVVKKRMMKLKDPEGVVTEYEVID